MSRHAALESKFQSELRKELEYLFPGCVLLKNDSSQRQGIPDLLILYKDKWAALEVKRGEAERRKPRPNQEYYVNKLNEMSYSAFIYPENKEEILEELQRSLRPSSSNRTTRVPKRK